MLELFLTDYLGVINVVIDKLTDITKELDVAMSDENNLKNILTNVNLFVENLLEPRLTVGQNHSKKYHYDYILTYLKHFSKSNLTLLHLLKKKTAYDYEERFINHTPKKFIKWLLYI